MLQHTTKGDHDAGMHCGPKQGAMLTYEPCSRKGRSRMDELRKRVLETIEEHRERMIALSRRIFEHPETAM